MGCDIHIVAQIVKNGFSDPIGFDDDLEERRYDTFTALAGVRRRRDDIPEISPPRGIPDDWRASGIEIGKPIDIPAQIFYLGPFHYWDYAHSHSWLWLPEIYAFDWKGYGIGGYKDGRTFADVCHHSFDQYGQDRAIRLTFWFDN